MLRSLALLLLLACGQRPEAPDGYLATCHAIGECDDGLLCIHIGNEIDATVCTLGCTTSMDCPSPDRCLDGVCAPRESN
jgi:hypothetical protein